MDKIKIQLYKKVIELFKKNNPEPATELKYNNSFQLLVAVVLSAQCTDERVNKITKTLFKKYPDSFEMARAKIEEIYEIIKSCSYPNSKAKYLYQLSNIIAYEYNGEVPANFDKLIKLPGVGRKSANVILSILYKKKTLAVDTHVFRVSQRIGLVEPTKSFIKVEKELIKYTPEKEIPNLHHWLILHGRYVCKSRKPLCNQCFLTNYCNYFKNFSTNI
jgi:endonuclease-3